jgi:hypothetical protein
LLEVLAGQGGASSLFAATARAGWKQMPGDQQVDQIQRFGEDGQVLARNFLVEAEIIVRTWH